MPSYISKRVADPARQAAMEVIANQFGRTHARHPLMETLRQIVPFDSFAMSGMAFFGLGVGRGVMLASDMPEAFIRLFLTEKLYHQDPMSYLMTAEQHWGSWHDLGPDVLTGPGVERIRQLERQFDITTRSAVGFFNGEHRFGGVTFCRTTPFSDHEKFILEMTTRVVHAELSDQLLSAMNQHLGLSEGELACLKHFADGLEVPAIHQVTGYATDTIYTYAKSAAKKMGVRGRTHAVAEALRRKVIA
ncbi:helix-turn-helix transcriptional regulator [Asticcacaulis sp.]|uniref:helix-turn-helix transcriptional regulator n=1 Tax=unclassified Asticcacaulis TaxID=2628350 RepID=UPI0025C05C3D|nr:autoinducer binding domain-containing protein [Asticcacaulis sp.]MCA1936306.1 autoinducer binding domain-containing protein [Asticcacaulis sp.]